MSKKVFCNVNGEVKLPLLELEKVKERFKNDDSAIRMNNLLNEASASSSSGRSSFFSTNLSIPQEPELEINKSVISGKYDDVSSNQIKNRMLKKHCFSLIPAKLDSDEEFEHANSLMDIDDYFSNKLKYNFRTPGGEKSINPLEKGRNSPNISSIRKKGKDQNKVMQKVKSTLQSLIKTNENFSVSKKNTDISGIGSQGNETPNPIGFGTGVQEKPFENNGAVLLLKDSELLKEANSIIKKETKVDECISKKETITKILFPVKELDSENQNHDKVSEIKESDSTENKKIESKSICKSNTEFKTFFKGHSRDLELKNKTLEEITVKNEKVIESENKLNEDKKSEQETHKLDITKEVGQEDKLIDKFGIEKSAVQDSEGKNKSSSEQKQEDKYHPNDDIKKVDTNEISGESTGSISSGGKNLLENEQMMKESKPKSTGEEKEIKPGETQLSDNSKQTYDSLKSKEEMELKDEPKLKVETKEKLVNVQCKMKSNAKEDPKVKYINKEPFEKQVKLPELKDSIKRDTKGHNGFKLNTDTSESNKSGDSQPENVVLGEIKMNKLAINTQETSDICDSPSTNILNTPSCTKMADKPEIPKEKSPEPKEILKLKWVPKAENINTVDDEIGLKAISAKIQLTNPTESSGVTKISEVKKVQLRETLVKKTKLNETQKSEDIPKEEEIYDLKCVPKKKEISKTKLISVDEERNNARNTPEIKMVPKPNRVQKVDGLPNEIEQNQNGSPKTDEKLLIKEIPKQIKTNKLETSKQRAVTNPKELTEKNNMSILKAVTKIKDKQDQILKGKINQEIRHSDVTINNSTQSKNESVEFSKLKLTTELKVTSNPKINSNVLNKSVKNEIFSDQIEKKGNLIKKKMNINKEVNSKGVSSSTGLIYNTSKNEGSSSGNTLDPPKESIKILDSKPNEKTLENQEDKDNIANRIKIKDSDSKRECCEPLDKVDPLKGKNIQGSVSKKDLKDLKSKVKIKEGEINLEYPESNQCKDILKVKWSKMIKDFGTNQSKPLSFKKGNPQINKDEVEKVEYKISGTKVSIQNNEIETQISGEINSYGKITSTASLRKIITLEDCINPEIESTNKGKNENSSMTSDSRNMDEDRGLKKPLLSERKRLLLKNHLTVPALQYRIYSNPKQAWENNFELIDEKKSDQENKSYSISPLNLFSKIYEMFSKKDEKDQEIKENYPKKIENTLVTSKDEIDIKPLVSKRHSNFGDSEVSLGSNVRQPFQKDYECFQRESQYCNLNNLNKRLTAIEKLLTSDFSADLSDYPLKKYSSKHRIEGNNGGKLVKRIPRKRIDRNLHRVIDLKQISRPNGELEDPTQKTNKVLKISLLENIIKSEHQFTTSNPPDKHEIPKLREISLEHEIGTSTVDRYEDNYLKSRMRRNYIRLLMKGLNKVEFNDIQGSTCSCHLCNKHDQIENKIDPITLHIMNEEKKIREIRELKNNSVCNNEKIPKHYHKHYHFGGSRSFRLHNKYKDYCHKHKGKHKKRHKHKCRSDEKNRKEPTNYVQGDNKKKDQFIREREENLHNGNNRNCSNNLYSSNDLAQIKDQIEIVLKQYGIIDNHKLRKEYEKSDSNFQVEACNISSLNDILKDTNTLLSQNLQDNKKGRILIESNLNTINNTLPKILKNSEICSQKLTFKEQNSSGFCNISEHDQLISDEGKNEIKTKDIVREVKQERLLRLPSNKLEKIVMRRNMMHMKLDLDKITQVDSNRFTDIQQKRFSKNGQRIAKGRRSIPRISKHSIENYDPNKLSLISKKSVDSLNIKTVKKTILKSSQQSKNNSEGTSWFSSWFGYSEVKDETGNNASVTQENVQSQIEKNDSVSGLSIEKEYDTSNNEQSDKKIIATSSKTKHENLPLPPQNSNGENKLNKYPSLSAKSDARATKATSNDEGSLDINDFIDEYDDEVVNEVEPNQEINNSQELEHNPEPKTEFFETENTFWSWFGYSSAPEVPKAKPKPKVAKTTQKSSSKGNVQKLKRKYSSKQFQKASQANPPPPPPAINPPAEETSWFNSWFGGGATESQPPPPPPTPVSNNELVSKQAQPSLKIENEDATRSETSRNDLATDPQQAPLPTPAPVENTSWFGSWFGESSEPPKESKSKDLHKVNVKKHSKSSTKKTNLKAVREQDNQNQIAMKNLPSIKITPVNETPQPVEESSWFSGWFGATETTPAPPPTPTAAATNLPQTQEQTPVQAPTSPSAPQPVEESSWFSGWFGTTETTPAPPPTPTATLAQNQEQTNATLNSSDLTSNPTPKSPQKKSAEGKKVNKKPDNKPSGQAPVVKNETRPVEESSWFSGWFGATETTPAPPPTPTTATNPPQTIEQAPAQEPAPSSTPQPAEESSWFSGWFGTTETTPAPPPTPTATASPTQIQAQAPVQEPSPSVTPQPVEESSWFSGWFGTTEPTPAPPPTPTTKAGSATTASGTAQMTNQCPANNTAPEKPTEEYSWLGGWMGENTNPAPPAPPSTPNATPAQESGWFSGFGW
ncbi:large low complexity protein with predicted coiled coil regions [Cryptosporidium felis]|nr:large low complexity protein with predicted coiled coil regions [Cryptosporidium felis]